MPCQPVKVRDFCRRMLTGRDEPARANSVNVCCPSDKTELEIAFDRIKLRGNFFVFDVDKPAAPTASAQGYFENQPRPPQGCFDSAAGSRLEKHYWWRR